MEELHPDLFSDKPTPISQPKTGSLKDQIGYKKADKGEPSCKDCPNIRRLHHHDKTYYKCTKLGISNSEATDVRLSGTCKYHPEKVKHIAKLRNSADRLNSKGKENE